MWQMQPLATVVWIPFLETLHLYEMKGLECIPNRDMSEEVSTLSFFPSFKSLEICGSPYLKGWWRSASMPDHQQHLNNQSLPSFPCLSSFWIRESPNMTSMPLLPYLEKFLSLNNVSLKPFQETILLSSSSSSSSPLSKLKHMEISCMEDVVSLPHGWTLNLISLGSLYIWHCKELNLGNMEWRHLNCLNHLEFDSLPKLNSLPAGLQHVTTLKRLTISHSENLKTSPRWIRKLISLESLIIGDCHNLKSLPNETRDLTSLQCLGIFSCPELRKRSEKETGQDWNKIAQITTGMHSIYPFF